MRRANPKERPYFASLVAFLILAVCCSCTTLRPPPKVSKGLTNVERQEVDVINGFGTEYKVKFTDPDFDKWVCMPAKQFIDATAWLQELIVVLTKGAK